MIRIKQFVFNSFQVNCYLLTNELNQGIIIDPACDSKQERDTLFDYIFDNNITIIKIIITHAHVDHITGLKPTLDKFNKPVTMHKNDSFLLDNAKELGAMYGFNIEAIDKSMQFIEEGENIQFGSSELEIMHIPGHSPGSIIIYSSNDKFAITGDVLFCGSIGRTDLPGGDYDTLIEGIKTKLLNLASDTVVYCGHGPSTIIEQEKKTNPFLV